jgi:hypothetical protein
MSELTDCYRQLERISKSIVQKNEGANLNLCGMSRAKVEKAMALDEATKTPEGARIAKRIIELQHQKIMRAQFAPILKNMPKIAGDLTDDDTFNRYQEAARSRARNEDEDDEWPCHCEKVDEDDLLAELKETRERESKLIQLIREIRGA